MPKKPKKVVLPRRYEAGFLAELDRRTEIYQRLNEVYETIVEDAGGRENLSHIKLSLIERFVFLEALLQTWERRIATKPTECDALLSRWVQAVNSLQGLAKAVGVERQARKVVNLQSYLKEREA